MQKPIVLTPAQESILDIQREQNFLVSASAGAGKTTVMVERIKKLIEKKHAQVDKMLVVTFTKLSASEMKQKLFDKLDSTTDPFIIEQREQIDTCNIGTIHSFCADVIREYFYLLDIDPNFSVLETNEADLLFDRATERVFEDKYRIDHEFLAMVDAFCPSRDDETLKKNVKKIYEFTTGIEDVEEWYVDTFKEFDDESIQKYFNDKVVKQNAYLKDKVYDLSLVFGRYDATNMVEKLEEIRVGLCANDKNDLKTNVEWLSQLKIPNVKKDDKDISIFNCTTEEYDAVIKEYDILRSKVKDLLDYAKTLLSKLSPEAQAQQKLEESFCRFCLSLTQEVAKVYSNLKKEKNVVDFSDMEKMTLQVLKDARAFAQIQEGIDYVFVDEFQDVNGIQQKILTSIAKPNRLFVVGDVKQSIYGFRQADPDIFVRMQKQYETPDTNDKVVLMNDNFRCDKQIGDFVNAVFNPFMTQEFGNVDYKNSGNLKANSDVKIKGEDVCVEVVRLDPTLMDKPFVADEIYDITQKADEDEIVKSKAEGRFIANKIKQLVGRKKLIDGEEIEVGDDQDQDKKYLKYKDIVILCRGLKNDTVELYKQLLKEGIPVVVGAEDQTNYKEIDDLVAFFKVINNPYDDYTLATLLTSPLCQITFDELVEISSASKSQYLWQKLLEYQQKEDILAKKIKDLLALLDRFAILSKVLKSGELMLKLLQETDYEKYVTALPNGSVRRERLFAFIQQVGALTLLEMIEAQLNVGDIPVGETAEDVVRIMTMHASKGLEFDVVFLAELHKGFNNRIKGNIRINKRCGMSVESGSDNTLRSLLVSDFDAWKLKEEELRLFYVAMTRAKRKLICSFVKEPTDEPLSDPSQASSMSDWLSIFDYDSDECRYDCLSAFDLLLSKKEKNNEITQTQDLTDVQNKVQREYAKALEWQYPYHEWLELPLKVVSSKLDMQLKLKQDFTDEPTDEVAEITQVDLTAQQEGEDKTQIGKAYHKIFERCDFEESKTTLNQTIDLLVEEGWFDKDIAKQVDLSKIKDVLSNPEFKKLYDGGKVYKEMPFLTTLPYDQLFGEGCSKEIMLQGVIDLLIVKDDHAIVVDFKVTNNSYKVKERYQKQLNSYAMAVNKCLKLPVKTYVVSILDNKVIEF